MKKYLIVLMVLIASTTFGQPIQMGSSKNYIPKDYVWQDIRVSLLSTTAGGSNPPGLIKVIGSGTSQGVFAFGFDRNIEEEVYTSIQIPHGIRKTVFSPHLHWASIDNNIATVTWGIEWIYYNYNIVGSASTEIYRATQGTSGTALKHQIVEFPDINISNIKDSAIILIRIFRDATNDLDTYNADALAYDFDCHYQTNSLGSSEKYGDN